MDMKDKAIGFYFTLVAAILSLAGLIIYPSVMYRLPIVYGFCAVAVLLTIMVVLSSFIGKTVSLFRFLPVINSALMASAAVWAVYLMVNQLGYVVAELDSKSTIMGLVYFEVVAVLSMLINIVGAFLKQDK